jgi:hypothetical protein
MLCQGRVLPHTLLARFSARSLFFCIFRFGLSVSGLSDAEGSALERPGDARKQVHDYSLAHAVSDLGGFGFGTRVRDQRASPHRPWSAARLHLSLQNPGSAQMHHRTQELQEHEALPGQSDLSPSLPVNAPFHPAPLSNEGFERTRARGTPKALVPHRGSAECPAGPQQCV